MKYWFRQKTFGYGATPVTWQGWTLTIAGIVLMFGVVTFGPAIRDNVLRALWFALGVPAVLAPFTYIAWCKTEGGWRWRSGD
jgi:hypothetical protein